MSWYVLGKIQRKKYIRLYLREKLRSIKFDEYFRFDKCYLSIWSNRNEIAYVVNELFEVTGFFTENARVMDKYKKY